jgi:hypothetical protein
MKYEKQFREAYPETISETYSAFDMNNYIEWIDSRFEKSLMVMDVLSDGFEFLLLNSKNTNTISDFKCWNEAKKIIKEHNSE